MVRFFLYIFWSFLFIEIIILIIDRIKKSKTDICNKFPPDNNSTVNSSSKEIKDERYWWYNSPHYWISSSGRKINMPEYITYDEYKHSNKSVLIEKLIIIDHRLSTQENPDENENIKLSEDEI